MKTAGKFRSILHHGARKTVKHRSSGWPHGTMLLMAGFVLFVSLYVAAAWYALVKGTPTLLEDVPAITVRAGADARVPFAELRPGKLVVLRQSVDTEHVRFVVIRSTDGIVRAAIASCPNCYEDRDQHGMRESGLICARCRNRMHIPGPEEPDKRAGCDLVKLPYRQENGDVVISASAVAEAAHALRKDGFNNDDNDLNKNRRSDYAEKPLMRD